MRTTSQPSFIWTTANKLIRTLDPRYNVHQYNADSVITQLRLWMPIVQGLTKAG